MTMMVQIDNQFLHQIRMNFGRNDKIALLGIADQTINSLIVPINEKVPAAARQPHQIETLVVFAVDVCCPTKAPSYRKLAFPPVCVSVTV